jgi:hypothetical protein
MAVYGQRVVLLRVEVGIDGDAASLLFNHSVFTNVNTERDWVPILATNREQKLRPPMKSFAPVPLSALAGRTLSLTQFRLLVHLLGLRTILGYRDEFQVTDHELLDGFSDRKSGATLASCGMVRNTMLRARSGLQELGYIEVRPIPVNTGQNMNHYTLVAGKSIVYQGQRTHLLTVAVSADDTLYKEETVELTTASTPDLRSFDDAHAAPSEDSIIVKMVARIKVLYTLHHVDSLAMPNYAMVKGALKRFIKQNPAWSTAAISGCIESIYESSPAFVNKAKSPELLIKQLPTFSNGPLNNYGQVRNPSLGQSEDD